MIRTIVFDLGGVIFNIDKRQAIRRFNEAGFADAARYLDAFHQVGIFGELESGAITAEQFRARLSELAGKPMTMDDCARGWQGYFVDLPASNLDKLVELRGMVADLRATVDKAEKATANVKAIQENKLTIFLLVAILTLLICQVIWKFGAGVWATLKERRRAYIVAEAEKLRQQYAQQTQASAQPVAAATTTQQ